MWPSPRPRRTLLLVNGRVVTMDKAGTVAEAVAVSGDRVVAVGTTAGIRALAGSGTRTIDLEGRAVLPGFIDPRIHGPFGFWEASFSAALIESDGSPMSRPESIEARLKQWIVERKPAAGDWLVAAGFNPKLSVTRGFDRTLADRIAPDNPLLMLSLDHRVALVNGRAIEAGALKGLDARLDSQGAPTGLVRESAVLLLMNRVWGLQSENVRRDATQRFQETAARFGITTVGSPMMVPEDLKTAETLISEGRMPVRLVASALGANEIAHAAFTEYRDARKSPDPDRLAIGPALYELDGTLISWGAARFQPYKDSSWTTGLLAMPPAAIERLVRTSAVGSDARDGVAIEANGELAVHLLFDALEKDPSTRVRADSLEAIDGFDRERLSRVAKTGLVALLQPTRFPFRLFVQASIGEEQMAHAMPYRTLVEAGVPVAISSDWPMTAQTFRPAQLIEWAVTRAGWLPEEGLTVAQALRACTIDAARALGLQDRLGSIEPGKKADLVVLDRDPRDLASTPEQISEIAVRLTVAGGSIEFEDRADPKAALPHGAGTTGKLK